MCVCVCACVHVLCVCVSVCVCVCVPGCVCICATHSVLHIVSLCVLHNGRRWFVIAMDHAPVLRPPLLALRGQALVAEGQRWGSQQLVHGGGCDNHCTPCVCVCVHVCAHANVSNVMMEQVVGLLMWHMHTALRVVGHTHDCAHRHSLGGQCVGKGFF